MSTTSDVSGYADVRSRRSWYDTYHDKSILMWRGCWCRENGSESGPPFLFLPVEEYVVSHSGCCVEPFNGRWMRGSSTPSESPTSARRRCIPTYS